MVKWILALVVLLVPPLQQEQQAREPDVIAQGRYASIAEDIASVVETSPPLFTGPDARERTAALVVARAFYESSFKRDVDEGRTRGDGGRAVCLMQMHFSPQGWTTDELVADRTKCIRSALELMRRSRATCRQNTPEQSLAVYTGGRCDRGMRESERTFAMADWLIAQRPIRGVSRGRSE